MIEQNTSDVPNSILEAQVPPPPADDPSGAASPIDSADPQPNTPASNGPMTDDRSEAVDAVISEGAAMDLVHAIDRNGSEPAPEPARAIEPIPPAPPEAPPVPPVPSVLDTLKLLGDQVNGRLEVIQAMVERELRAEMTRERVVDRLHAELQEYKQDLLLKVLRPMFVDLIQLHDDIGKMQETTQAPALEEGAEVAVDKSRPLLESIRTGIEDILYRQGVEPFEQEEGAFDARRQRAVTTVQTEDPALNKTVAARLRKGFQAGDKIIRPEIVSVYTLKK